MFPPRALGLEVLGKRVPRAASKNRFDCLDRVQRSRAMSGGTAVRLPICEESLGLMTHCGGCELDGVVSCLIECGLAGLGGVRMRMLLTLVGMTF